MGFYELHIVFFDEVYSFAYYTAALMMLLVDVNS